MLWCAAGACLSETERAVECASGWSGAHPSHALKLRCPLQA
jgi:hypothetical protein